MHIDNVLSRLKNKISPQEYENYIMLMEYDENASRVDSEVFYVPNIFVAHWVMDNYVDSIAEAFCEENANGVRPEIHIKIKKYNDNVKSLEVNKNTTHFQTNALSLNPYYTFEVFVVGKSNEHAHTIAKIVAEQQATRYNPVTLYGHSGLGKTHLLNSIGNYVKEKNKNVIYITAENFLNEYTEKIRRGTMDSFRDKYRNCDYLLIDDVQFLGG
ncbi:DnaA ATPase domain-containing protein, partial [Helicobacter typhlonius]